MSVEQKVKQIIVEQLGVDEAQVDNTASFVDDQTQIASGIFLPLLATGDAWTFAVWPRMPKRRAVGSISMRETLSQAASARSRRRAGTIGRVVMRRIVPRRPVPRRVPGQRTPGAMWYSMAYTTTPVTETYSQIGSVARAMRRWAG